MKLQEMRKATEVGRVLEQRVVDLESINDAQIYFKHTVEKRTANPDLKYPPFSLVVYIDGGKGIPLPTTPECTAAIKMAVWKDVLNHLAQSELVGIDVSDFRARAMAAMGDQICVSE